MKNKAKSTWGKFTKVMLSINHQSKIKGGVCCDPGEIPPPPPKKTAQTNQNGG